MVTRDFLRCTFRLRKKTEVRAGREGSVRHIDVRPNTQLGITSRDFSQCLTPEPKCAHFTRRNNRRIYSDFETVVLTVKTEFSQDWDRGLLLQTNAAPPTTWGHCHNSRDFKILSALNKTSVCRWCLQPLNWLTSSPIKTLHKFE